MAIWVFTHSSYGEAGGKANLCAEHAKDGIVNVRHEKCNHTRCTKHPSYSTAASRKRVFSATHAEDGTVSVSRRRQSSDNEGVGDSSARGRGQLALLVPVKSEEMLLRPRTNQLRRSLGAGQVPSSAS